MTSFTINKRYRVMIRPIGIFKYSFITTLRKSDEELHIWYDGAFYHIEDNEDSNYSQIIGGLFIREGEQHGFLLLEFLDDNNPTYDDDDKRSPEEQKQLKWLRSIAMERSME